jgi:ribosomal protein L11 methyltransferase
MTYPILWQINVITSPEAEPAVSTLLSELFNLPASSYTPAAQPLTTVSVFCTSNPGPQPALANRIANALPDYLPHPSPPCRVSVRKLHSRDWTSFWRRHFRPITIAKTLLVKPSWSTRRPGPGQKSILLDPGLSFGTGHHPTTAFCLRHIVALRPNANHRSLLDLGTGSGILAIAAAKLDYRPIVAIDADPDAVRIAITNAQRNRIQSRLQFRHLDLRHLPLHSRTRFDVVCANLTTDLLLAQSRRIANFLQHHGSLILAGILNSEFRSVQSNFQRLGLTLIAHQSSAEWKSGLFTRTP